jgi:hypothetical protein
MVILSCWPTACGPCPSWEERLIFLDGQVHHGAHTTLMGKLRDKGGNYLIVPRGAGELHKSRQLPTSAEIFRCSLTERSCKVTVENGRPVELMVVIKDALVSPSAVSECKPAAGGFGRRWHVGCR